LETLWLDCNEIEEIRGLEHLTNLETLNLDSNRIQEITGLEELTKLRDLRLSGNKIKEIKGLEHLTHLRELDLSYNNIEVIKGLGRLRNLRFLNLNYNYFLYTATETDELEQLTNLDIYLLGTPLGGGEPFWTLKEKWQYFIHSAKDVAALARGDVTLEEIGGWWEHIE
jgi:Leucine-rich repeat (LRR) protein